MSLSSLKGAVRHCVAIVLVGAFPVGMWAQDAQTAPPQTASSQSSGSQTSLPAAPAAPAPPQPFQMKDYSKPRGYFPNPLAPYTQKEMAPPDLTNSPKLDQLMR